MKRSIFAAAAITAIFSAAPPSSALAQNTGELTKAPDLKAQRETEAAKQQAEQVAAAERAAIETSKRLKAEEIERIRKANKTVELTLCARGKRLWEVDIAYVDSKTQRLTIHGRWQIGPVPGDCRVVGNFLVRDLMISAQQNGMTGLMLNGLTWRTADRKICVPGVQAGTEWKTSLPQATCPGSKLSAGGKSLNYYRCENCAKDWCSNCEVGNPGVFVLASFRRVSVPDHEASATIWLDDQPA